LILKIKNNIIYKGCPRKARLSLVEIAGWQVKLEEFAGLFTLGDGRMKSSSTFYKSEGQLIEKDSFNDS
jgi:hypothetical protein